MIAFFLVFMISVFIGTAIFVYKKIQETDPNNAIANQKIKTTQEFLPYESIQDSVVDLGMFQYRAIIKCHSINYELKTEKEQEMVELSYQRFLNSLSHPISIYIQTKTMNHSNMMKQLRVDIDESAKEFPFLKEYGELYYQEMAHIYETIGNTKEKNKYIIVPYNEAIALTNANDEEKREYAIRELSNRCQSIIDGLQSIGIRANVLNTNEIISLLYHTSHRDATTHTDEIVSGEYLSMMVDGENKLASATNETKLEWILYESQMRLQGEVLEQRGVSKELYQKTMVAIDEINKIREVLAKKG